MHQNLGKILWKKLNIVCVLVNTNLGVSLKNLYCIKCCQFNFGSLNSEFGFICACVK